MSGVRRERLGLYGLRQASADDDASARVVCECLGALGAVRGYMGEIHTGMYGRARSKRRAW